MRTLNAISFGGPAMLKWAQVVKQHVRQYGILTVPVPGPHFLWWEDTSTAQEESTARG
jgi:hypothetical protein